MSGERLPHWSARTVANVAVDAVCHSGVLNLHRHATAVGQGRTVHLPDARCCNRRRLKACPPEAGSPIGSKLCSHGRLELLGRHDVSLRSDALERSCDGWREEALIEQRQHLAYLEGSPAHAAEAFGEALRLRR